MNQFMNTPEIIYSYTRAQALEDGVLVSGNEGDFAEVSAQHFKHPIAMTLAVFELIKKAVENPNYENDYKGVWHDILSMSINLSSRIDESTRLFRVIITGTGIKRIHELKIVCHGGDNAEPVLTVMLSHED
jgi:hypothetical protein